MPYTSSLGKPQNKSEITDVNHFSPLFDTIIDQLRDSASGLTACDFWAVRIGIRRFVVSNVVENPLESFFWIYLWCFGN